MNYKRAFLCKSCPGRNDKEGCPCWVEVIWSSIKTGEEKVIKDCLFRMLPEMMVEVIKASNRPAASVESTRNEIAKGFDKVERSIKIVGQLYLEGLKELVDRNKEKGEDNIIAGEIPNP